MAGSDSRSTFVSSWGTVLATAGVAIGLGNIWRFPYMMGKYGGAVFLGMYLVAMLAFGVPALMAEWTLGRYTRRGTWGAFQRAGLPGASWCSRALLLTVTLAASYYGVVLAWILYFALSFARTAITAEGTIAFEDVARNETAQFILVIATVSISCAALMLDVKRGIEKLSTFAVPVFFLLFGVLVVRVLTLDGAIAGIYNMFTPRWDMVTAATPLAVVGQVFFSLGLGGTFMLCYGSYLRDAENIPKTAAKTVTMDLAAALLAGLIIIPSAVVYSVELHSGPALLFEVMPKVFGQMPSGPLFAALFFGSVFLVAILSLMAAYEVLVAGLYDARRWSRRRSLLIIGIVEIVLALPAIGIDGYIEYSDFLWGSTMQPIGGAIAVLAVAWCLGRSVMVSEIARHSPGRLSNWLFVWIKYGIPIGVIGALVSAWR